VPPRPVRSRLSPRELAYCGLFGAAALLLPTLFHLVRLGHVFMPMYLPLVTLAFFVRPLPAAVTALVTPLLSGAVTGMPPFFPPVAVFMSIELAVMSAVIAWIVQRRPRVQEWMVLVPVLLLGRALYVGLVYAFSLAIHLPAAFMAGLSLLGGWPGIILMVVVVPPLARMRQRTARSSTIHTPAGPRERANPRAEYFDGIADRWDSWEDLTALRSKLMAGLDELAVGAGETVLDVGCGTGNLTDALLARLSDSGRVVAVDIAPRMIDVARRKIDDARVTWHAADARRLPLADGSCDRAVCYSVWPHFDDRAAVAAELSRVLRPGGRLHVWHLLSRERINEIHASAGDAVRRDQLPPAQETANVLAGVGFQVRTAVDDHERYLVTAIKPAV